MAFWFIPLAGVWAAFPLASFSGAYWRANQAYADTVSRLEWFFVLLPSLVFAIWGLLSYSFCFFFFGCYLLRSAL